MAMPRWLIVAALGLAVALATSQLLLPSIAEREVEERLTEGGGSAQVTMSAVPAVRLLFTDGKRFEIEASDLTLDLDEDLDAFERLDGFEEVAISIHDSSAGPFELEAFELAREGAGAYSMTSSGHASAAALADFGADSLGIPGGPVAGMAAQALLGEAGEHVPIELDMRLASAEGTVEVVEGDATVAGFPAGPIAEIIASSIASRL